MNTLDGHDQRRKPDPDRICAAPHWDRTIQSRNQRSVAAAMTTA